MGRHFCGRVDTFFEVTATPIALYSEVESTSASPGAMLCMLLDAEQDKERADF